jgi:multidrug efflux pump subunit AcrA (membrane-fusion protein)
MIYLSTQFLGMFDANFLIKPTCILHFKKNNMRTPLFSFLFLTIALITSISCSKEKKVISPEYRSISEAVYASGQLVPETEYKIISNTDGILAGVYVQENDIVQKGALLFEIVSAARATQTDILENIYQTTLKKNAVDGPALREIESKIELAKKKVTTDSIHLHRLNRLLENSLISKNEWDQANLKYEVSMTELNSLVKSRENLLIQSKLESRQAENQLRNVESQNKEGKITSLIDGRVFRIYKNKGERTGYGEPLALLGSSDKWKMELTIDERDFGLIEAGQKIVIRMDAFPDELFEAKIDRLIPFLNRAEQSFIAEAVFIEPFTKGIYGLNLEANILIREKEKALCIPGSALIGKDSVWIESDKGPMKVKVVTGIRSLDQVEILQGLSENDKVILNPN